MQVKKTQYLAILVLLILVPLGLYTKYYSGPCDQIINNQSGGMFYVMFFCLLAYVFYPHQNPIQLCAIVLFITIMLEISQLWHPIFLEKIRDTWFGAILIGKSYHVKDIPWYIAGAIISFLLLKQLKKSNNKKK